MGRGQLAVKWESSDRLPAAVRRVSEDYHRSARETEALRRAFAELDDDPDLALHRIGPGEWSTSQNLVVSGKGIESPHLFCLSREPVTRSEWEKLRAALPERYDAWTVTEDVDAVQFEIECGIKRWFASQRITRHTIVRANGWGIVEMGIDGRGLAATMAERRSSGASAMNARSRCSSR